MVLLLLLEVKASSSEQKAFFPVKFMLVGRKEA